jgi:DNA repair exonuclease SbcCD ATPase subunit
MAQAMRSEKREINWGFDTFAEPHRPPPPGGQRFAIHAAFFVIAGLATILVPLVLENWSGRWEIENLFAGSTLVAPRESIQDAANSPTLPIKHQRPGEQERKRDEVLALQLASAQELVRTMTARIADLSGERSEAEQALQTAQALAAEQKQALEQERARGDTLLRELVSAREEVEARETAAHAASAFAKNAESSAAKQKQAAEQERQRADGLVHELAAAQVDIAALTARVTILTGERSEAEKASRTAQVSAAEQKQAFKQERERGELYEKAVNLGPPQARKLEVPKAFENAADALVINAPTVSPVPVPPGGSNEIPTGSGGSPAVLQALPRPRPQRLDSRGAYQGGGAGHSQWLRDHFPDDSQRSRLRLFGNRDMPGRHGQGPVRRQNSLSMRWFDR